jgi:hypothetical protein
MTGSTRSMTREPEEATEAAIARDAEVLAVDGPDLGPLGGIAALLRF